MKDRLSHSKDRPLREMAAVSASHLLYQQPGDVKVRICKRRLLKPGKLL